MMSELWDELYSAITGVLIAGPRARRNVTDAVLPVVQAHIDAAREQVAEVEAIIAQAQHPVFRCRTLAEDVELIWQGRTQARKACEEWKAERDAAVARAEQAEAEVKDLRAYRLVVAVFGVPKDAPQPFALLGGDNKPFALGVQWPGGAVTVKSTPPERLGNVTSASLDDYFTQYGASPVVWLSEDLGTLAEHEERAIAAEQAVQCHIDAAREQVAEQIAQAIEARAKDGTWNVGGQIVLEIAAGIAREHAQDHHYYGESP